MRKAFKILGIGALGLLALLVFALMVIGTVSPETYVYEGDEVPAKFIKKVKALGLLEEGETVEYFYSDGFLKLEEGVYFLTENKIALYAEVWDLEKTLIPYETIAEIDVEYDDSFLTDSMVTVTDYEGVWVSFPVSSEKGRDKAFVQAIERHSGVSAGSQIE